MNICTSTVKNKIGDLKIEYSGIPEIFGSIIGLQKNGSIGHIPLPNFTNNQNLSLDQNIENDKKDFGNFYFQLNKKIR